MDMDIDLNGTTPLSEAIHVPKPYQNGGKEHGDEHLQFLATALNRERRTYFNGNVECYSISFHLSTVR